MDLAEVYALLGRPALAVEYLKKSYEAGATEFFFPVILPKFRSLRTNPEFRALFKLDR